MTEDHENEQILAAMVRYLYETGKRESAKALLSAQLASYDTEHEQYNNAGDVHQFWQVLLRGSATFVREVTQMIDRYNEEEDEKYKGHSDLFEDIREAFNALMPELPGWTHITAKLEIVPVDTNWRAMMLAEIETDKPTNQGPLFAKPENVFVYEGLKFASPPEVSIAKALDKLGIMYFANCMARLGLRGEKRQNKSPDFLITYQGKWGILEVDGQTYHTSNNATQDHERQRLLEQHGGIKYFTRFTAKECMNEPDKVVQKFLSILETR